MSKPVDVILFFNFRSPYCYLASKTLWPIVDDFDTRLVWRPVGGWDLRSPPDRAKIKVPLARQDLARFARRFGMTVSPPPPTTDPTLAGAGSLLAEERGLLRRYIVEVMNTEWAQGQDIGNADILLDAGVRAGLDRGELARAIEDEDYLARLRQNALEAAEIGVIGVPTFVIGKEIFWGQDRIDFVLEELTSLGAKKTT